MLGGPPRYVAVINDFDFPGPGVMYPHERAALDRLAPAAEFGRVVRDRGPEV